MTDLGIRRLATRLVEVHRVLDMLAHLTHSKDHTNVHEWRSSGRLRTVCATWVVNALDEADYAFDFKLRPTRRLQEPTEVVLI